MYERDLIIVLRHQRCSLKPITHIVPIEVKAGTNSHLRALHSFVNLNKQPVTAVRVWRVITLFRMHTLQHRITGHIP